MKRIYTLFTRVNPSRLRRKLEELGYKPLLPGSEGSCLSVDIKDRTYMEIKGYTVVGSSASTIDCGTNEDLFLALVSFRTDTDYLQWFVIPYPMETVGGSCKVLGECWVLYPNKDFLLSKKIKDLTKHGKSKALIPHKATLKEILKHFKHPT